MNTLVNRFWFWNGPLGWDRVARSDRHIWQVMCLTVAARIKLLYNRANLSREGGFVVRNLDS